MRERGYGKIINLSGGGGTGPRPNFSAYATAKAGWCASPRRWRARCEGIDVNAIAPGALNTRMRDDVLEAGPELRGRGVRADPRPRRDVLRARDGARRLPRERGQRRRQRPPDRRPVGRLAHAARAGAGRRRLYAAPDRPVSDYTRTFLDEAAELARGLPVDTIDAIVDGLAAVREGGGRLFILGVGGGAGPRLARGQRLPQDLPTSRATRRPTTSPSSPRGSTTTAGRSAYAAWLKGSRLDAKDAVLIFWVGGGSREHGVSMNLVAAIELAREVGARIYGIVGKADGDTAQRRRRLHRRPRPGRAPHAARRGLPGRRLAPGRLPSPRWPPSAGKWESIAGGSN